MIRWMEPCSSLQKYLGFRFENKKCNSLSPQININSYQSQSLFFMFKPCKCCLTLLWVLSNSLTLVRTLSYSHDQDHVHSINTCRFPHWKLCKTCPYTYIINSLSWHVFLQKPSSKIWAMQKEVRYMLKSMMQKKKKENMHTQRWYATCSQGMSK